MQQYAKIYLLSKTRLFKLLKNYFLKVAEQAMTYIKYAPSLYYVKPYLCYVVHIIQRHTNDLNCGPSGLFPLYIC